MDWRTKGWIAAIAVAILSVITVQNRRITELRTERDKYRSNSETLFGEAERYKTADSLNGARIDALELTLKEYQRFRAEDAALIKSLSTKNRDLASVNKTQSQTILALQAIPKDTIIIRDSVPVPAVALHCGDAWYDFDGLLTEDSFSGTLCNRDSLVLVESVRSKRFLGFLWKTRRVQDRRLDCLSKNPHTEILDLEHILIEK